MKRHVVTGRPGSAISPGACRGEAGPPHGAATVRWMKTIMTQLLWIAAAGLAFAACATGEPAATASEAEDALTQICTPLEETCDFGCFFNGGPSTDDCIIICNARGTAWKTVAECGYAQNGLTSASCLITQPHPICENN